MNISHFFHFPPAPADPRLDQIIALLQSLKQQGAQTMATLQEALAADEAAEAKIVGVLQTQSQQLTDLAQKLKDALAAGGSGPDEAAVQAVADQMMADAATMQAAADAAQPPAPAPTPDPAPTP